MNDNFQSGDRVTIRDGSSWDGKHATVEGVDGDWVDIRLDCHPQNIFPLEAEGLIPEIEGEDVEITIPELGTIVLKDWLGTSTAE